MMHPDDLIIVDKRGTKIEGSRECTSEILMHCTIYDMRPDVRSVLHAHPPVATGFATAGRPLDQALLPEVVIHLGYVPLAGYGLPGTPALTEPMLPYIPKYNAIMMGNHGVVSYGDDVYKAFFNMETVEHFARIAFVAELLGGAKVLPKVEVDKLLGSRSRYGAERNNGAAQECPVVAEDLERRAGRSAPTRAEVLALIDQALKSRGII